MSRYRIVSRIFSIAAIALPAVGLAGCAKNPHAPGSISGSISYNGQPIKAGSMRFHTAQGVAYDAQLTGDGTYSATDIPEGDLVITVETESISPHKSAPKGAEAGMRAKAGITQPPPPGMAPPPDPSALYIKIPEKYSNPRTSPLTVTVKRGRQIHDVKLD
jgi:hypothetical protein